MIIHWNFFRDVIARRKRNGIGSLTGITRAQSASFNDCINNICRSPGFNGMPVN